MTPDQSKREIQRRYDLMVDRSINGEVSPGAPHRVAEGMAMEAARHHGIPEAWRNFMPKNAVTTEQESK